MPRFDERPIRFTAHAERRMRQRGIEPGHAEHIVRRGAVRPDADCDFIASGSVGGRHLEAACVVVDGVIAVKTVY